ncbi:C6 transcription factor [Aspergillus nidulans var. acristatus]
MGSSSRVAVACTSCRKRKRKCDGLRPACSFCMARDRACEYNSEERIKRRVDPDYVRTLEDQVAMLKEELAQAQPSRPTVMNGDVAHADRNGERCGDGDGAVAISPSMTTAIEDVSVLIWCMSIDSNGDASFIGPSGNFCFPVTHWDNADIRGSRKTTAAPMNATTHLLDLFARFINPIHQFVDRDTLDQLSGDNLSPGVRLVKTAALAAGALFADDPQSRALGWEAAAVIDATAMQLCQQSPDISTIQALSIMSWRELGLEQHNMTWMYNSMCASLVLHLGLPVSISSDIGAVMPEPASLPPESRTRHTRLRTLSSSVFMDRYVKRRNCLLQWRRIKAPSFLTVVGPSPSLDELAFDHQCRLWFIHDQYMDNIYSFDFSELSSADRSRVLLDARDQLHSFYQHIHPSLQLNANVTGTPSILYLHISYHMSHILIHRPYLKDAAQNNPTIYRLAIRSVSIAATSIVRLLRAQAKILPLTQIPPFIVHSVLTAAVTHLYNATSSHQTLRNQATAHFRVCFRALLATQSRPVKAKRAVRLLRGLARRWRVMGALPLQYGFETGDGEAGQAGPG